MAEGLVVGSAYAVGELALAAVLFGLGVGAVVQVVVQILPSLREPGTRTFDAGVLGGSCTRGTAQVRDEPVLGGIAVVTTP